jgi:UDP-N-acetylmuramate dehydrogenase
VGRRLVGAVAHALAEAGMPSMLLWVFADNPARRFYEALGGQLVARQTFELGGTTLAEVAYGWPDVSPLRAQTSEDEAASDRGATTLPVPFDTGAMLAELTDRFGALVRAHEPLARHSTFAVGGPVDAWVTIEGEQQLVTLVELAVAHGWPLMLVGNGTNVLYADAGMRGIVAQMALSAWEVRDLDAERVLLSAGAGVKLPTLVNALAARGLTGLEWGAGVPGTIGGAIVSNAGAHGGATSDTLRTARVLFTQRAGDRLADAPAVIVEDVEAAELRLAYRHSRFRATRRITFDDSGRPSVPPRTPIEPLEMIVGGTFVLRHAPVAEVKARVAAYRQHRKQTQPPQASAGSVFKNPPDGFAGQLIEAAGLKGATIGKAQISPIHANFIVNTGGATAAEVVALIALARRTVRERTGIELELEVELRGDWA